MSHNKLRCIRYILPQNYDFFAEWESEPFELTIFAPKAMSMFRFFLGSHFRVALLAAVFLGGEAYSFPQDTCRVESDGVCIGRWLNRPVVEIGASSGRVLTVDAYQRQWLQATPMTSLRVGLRHRTRPDEADSFAPEYGYPEWGLSLLLGDCSGVKMQKHPSPDWGQLVPVGYVSDMGRIVALYGSFSRPLLHCGRWRCGYSLEKGLAYNTRPYNRQNNIDNELTGSHLLIWFGATAYAAYRLDERWILRADLAFRHVSNGALDRPNKGANTLAPEITLQYDLDEPELVRSAPIRHSRPFRPHWYGHASFGLGGRTLLEEWLITQYATSPSDPHYRMGHFRFRPTYNLQFDLMRRHARRWASGLGLDLFYMPYVGRLRQLSEIMASPFRHHPFSAGVALKHEAFYGRLSLYLSLGCYLFRRTGYLQSFDEKPYYERVGLRYRLPMIEGVTLGIGVKAHKTKADFTEITLGWAF